MDFGWLTFQNKEIFIQYWIITLALDLEEIRTFNSLDIFAFIFSNKSNLFSRNVYLFTVFYFFFRLLLKKSEFMEELSVLSISLSIASLGIFFLFFSSNDDDDQDGGKLIKSAQRIN